MNDIIYPEERQNNWRQQILKEYEKETQNPTKIYLASPYTHKSTNVMETRFIIICFLTAHFTEKGYCVYSPILNGHTMTRYINLPHEYNFWAARDKQFICWCDQFWQVRLKGWQDSTGMVRELTYARLLGKRLKKLDLSTGLSEREFSLECLFRRISGEFSEKVNLKIITREMS